MVLISKIDKKTWDNYVSNLEKTVIIPSKKHSINLNNSIKNTTNFNRNSTLASPKLLKKKMVNLISF